VESAPLRDELLQSLASAEVDLRGVLQRAGEAGLYERLVHEAGILNTPPLVDRASAEPRYKAERNRGVPRKIGSRLWLFDCINCDKCVPVCPNDANFAYETGPLAADYTNFRLEGGRVLEVPGGRFEAAKAHQLATFQDFCNECGNCDTFCPEDGGPYLEKPRFFGSLEAWRRLGGYDGFFLERRGGVDAAWARIAGTEYTLEVDRGADRGLFSDGSVSVEVRHSARQPLVARAADAAAEGHTLDFAAYLKTALVLDGVLRTERANPVNAALA
jgi:putative selenate reductase